MQKAVNQIDMNKLTTARNWDNTKIQVKMKDLHEWTVWDRYNRKTKYTPHKKYSQKRSFCPNTCIVKNIC